MDTTGKLKEVNGYVTLTLGKLPTICPDLTRTDDDWQEGDFWQFIEALRKWTDRNKIPSEGKQKLNPTKNKPG